MRARRTLFAIAAGAALQYFLDPERGAARRNRAREQIEPALRRGQQRVEEARSDQQSWSDTTDTGYTGSGHSSTTDTGYAGSETGLATPVIPSEDLPDAGLASTGLSTPATDLDDLTATDLTVTEVTVTDVTDLGADTPYAEPTDTYAGSDAPYTSTDDTFATSTDDEGAGGVPVDDYELADRVRSQVLGRDEFKSVVVDLDAVNGVVTLRGELDSATGDDLEDAVREVDGVRDVISYLHTPGTVAPNEEDVRG